MWTVYILLCSKGKLYTGSTNDLKKRLDQHKNGTGAKFTRSFKPVKVVYQELFSTKSEALKREIEIKKWRRVQKIAFLKLESI